ncbi:hypothetical protein EDB85DRAFT_2144704 [Lactarius pseudohatsudake]|nr:hypothetical protein EDB85DRAFT_2144704 [Lactarius pseudohatsudake]
MNEWPLRNLKRMARTARTLQEFQGRFVAMAAKVTDGDPGPTHSWTSTDVRRFLPHRLSRPHLPPSYYLCDAHAAHPSLSCEDRPLPLNLSPSPLLALSLPLSPLFLFLPPACPLSAPPSHSLPSHIRATVAFVLLLAAISSPRPSFHYPPLSLPSQSLRSSELSPSASALLSPVPYPYTFSFPSRNLTALGVPLALSAPSSSPCLTSTELCQPSANASVAIPTVSLPALLSPHPIHTLPTHPALIPPSTSLRHHLPCSGTLSPSCQCIPATRTARHPLTVAAVAITTLRSSPISSACVEDFNVDFIMVA